MQRFSEKRRFRRGNAAVVGLSLGAVLGFGALAVDIAVQRVADAQVQAAIEAAALGGAAELDRTIPGMGEARKRAVEIAALNAVAGEWELAPEDVQVGVYDSDTGEFEAIDPGTLVTGDPEVMDVNALRIETTHDGIAAVLAKAAFGVDGLSTANEAMAMRPNEGGTAKSVACYLPLAIPDCDYIDWMDGSMPDENPPPQELMNTNSVIDNVGWGRPQPKGSTSGNGHPSSNYLRDAFESKGCQDKTIELAQYMEVANGANNSVLRHIGDLLEGKVPDAPMGTWDYAVADRPSRDGIEANLPNVSSLSPPVWDDEPVIEGPVAMMQIDNCDPNIQFTGTWQISGFAWAMIYDVSSGGTKNLWVQLDFINPRDFGSDVDPDGMGPVTGLDKPVLVF